VLGISFGLGAS